MEIQILGRRLTVRFLSDREIQHISQDPKTIGFFENDCIYVSSSLNQKQTRRVLLHEISHAILDITGLSEILEDQTEEALCTSMENLSELFLNEILVNFMANKEEAL